MSKIEWTQATWNPLAGCSIVSPGCTNCYAMKMAARLEHMRPSLSHYRGLTQPSKAGPVWTGKVALAPDHILLEPLKRKKPTLYFVNSMSDLFHEDVPDEWIDRVFSIMAMSPQHTFQVLTKRSARMREYLRRHDVGSRWAFECLRTASGMPHADTAVEWTRDGLPNVWLGVSCEDQTRAQERIPDLMMTPAAVRFISAEPLLGPLDLKKWLTYGFCNKCSQWVVGTDRQGGGIAHHDCNYLAAPDTNLDWVIVGGESGPGARPMHPDWARGIRDQCVAAGVPYFFKQHGSWSTVYDRDRDDPDWRRCDAVVNDTPTGEWLNLAGGQGFHGERVVRVIPVSKKTSGRLLDGREWNEMPITHKTEAAA